MSRLCADHVSAAQFRLRRQFHVEGEPLWKWRCETLAEGTAAEVAAVFAEIVAGGDW